MLAGDDVHGPVFVNDRLPPVSMRVSLRRRAVLNLLLYPVKTLGSLVPCVNWRPSNGRAFVRVPPGFLLWLLYCQSKNICPAPGV